MWILGVTHPVNWNSSACLLKDGKLVSMVEEERLNRVKYAPQMVPRKAIQYCLNENRITLDDIDYIAVGFDSAAELYEHREADPADITRRQWLQFSDIHAQPIPIDPNGWFSHIKEHELRLPFAHIPEKVVFVNHHVAHAASAYFASPFDEAMILSLDGSGGKDAGMLAVGHGREIQILHIIPDEGSWGRMYELATTHLGFKRHGGEGKTMGLASYGSASEESFGFIDWSMDIPAIDEDTMRHYFSSLRTQASPETVLKPQFTSLAATVQASLESATKRMVRWLHNEANIANLCIAGGVGLNCVMNGKLAELPFVESTFVQPASHDAGTSLGAALALSASLLPESNFDLSHVYYGPEYDLQTIADALNGFSEISYSKAVNVEREVATLLATGNVIAWFQGRLEVGPRALGNRSILADPSKAQMKDHINRNIKKREEWRPFAPAILEEQFHRYIQTKLPQSPFMTISFPITDRAKEEIPAAIHVDGTCRPQSVSKEINLRLWSLISAFYKITGVPALLNTSFNIKDEPIVNSPGEAIETFLKTELDVLVLGDYIVHRTS